MSIIWVTRGRSWGFRFLRDGGYPNPLEIYENAFANIDDSLRVFQITDSGVAVRFPDPLGRQDRAGRIIPHEFVISEQEAQYLANFDDAYATLWGKFRDEYEKLWDPK